jgi:hypothetical protein
MKLTENLSEKIRAGFSGIWVQSFEQEDAMLEIAKMCHDQDWCFATWDIDQGLLIQANPIDQDTLSSDPVSMLRASSELGTQDQPSVLVLSNFHHFFGSAEVIQCLQHKLNEGKRTGCIYVVLSSVVQIPQELEKLFIVMEHELPNREQLNEIASSLTQDDELPSGKDLENVLDAASGLTRMEAENAFSLSLVRDNKISSTNIWELKTQTLKKSGLLSLYQGEEDFCSLGGLESLKTFCRRVLLRPNRSQSPTKSRGVLLLSPPGSGKSAFCKALGKEVGRPVLMLDVGNLMGSLVGQTEQKTRDALAIADSMQPCILMIDEIEKAFSGLNGQGDSGVSSRMFGTFLSWLNDHTSDVFVVCTSNDISKLPPEFGRSERFDGIFFIDLPTRKEKDLIWKIYLKQYEVDITQSLPSDNDWTGAEVKSCCRLSSLLDLPINEASKYVIPVALTASESVDRLRNWASGRCLSASSNGVYQHEIDTSLKFDPANN